MCRSGIDDGRLGDSRSRAIRLQRVLLAVLALAWASSAGAGQLGALVSPGPLAKAHAQLEGVGKCQSCHEVGRKVTAARCLTCHKPIAERIARSVGVHRAAKECVSCHVDHAGADAELRHLDTRTFNHAAETGFALDGLHARAAANCAACHKTRSFLDARVACSACHTDVHAGQLGADCTRCHSTKVAFKSSRGQFNHATARFALTGAHNKIACESCHKKSVFRGLAFDTCTACHVEPHRRKLGATCTSCHTTETWATRTIDHGKTAFPLVGAHAVVGCQKCHQPGMLAKPVRADRCSACHVNVHRDSAREDCRTCHTETTFKGAPFDHSTRTSFALAGKHVELACRACHTSVSPANVPLARKVVDFRGVKSECVACHGEKDPHNGRFGGRCDSCHGPATFSVTDFKHRGVADFYGGQHERVACERCHVPAQALLPRQTEASGAAGPKALTMACAGCHTDVHLGQIGVTCERCHAVAGAKFAAAAFVHDRARFALTGAHQSTACATCHRTETRVFPGGHGTAVVFNPVDMRCQSCHRDPHLEQLDARCETCHQTGTFALTTYTHRGMDDFFGGIHGKYVCKDCHKSETGQFPAGRGTATRFLVGRTCASCHRAF